MPGTAVTEELEIKHEAPPGGGGGEPEDDGGAGPEGEPPRRISPRIYYTGISLALIGIVMFFMALVSAYIVRRGPADWRPVEVPPILWLNTGVLLASSFTIVYARQRLKRADDLGFRAWWGITTTFGVLFLAGQIVAWRQLFDAGVFHDTNPASSFFYLLTAAHGLHLLGGIAALLYVQFRRWERAQATRVTVADVSAIYWHSMDGLWVFLFLLFVLGR